MAVGRKRPGDKVEDVTVHKAQGLANFSTKAPNFGQEVLDSLTKLSPVASLDMVADLLDPSSDVESYSEWLKKNLPDIFPHPFGPHHRWILDEFQMKPHGLRLLAAAPRGSGKTAVSMIGIPLATLAMGTHNFVVIIGNTQDEAQARLGAVRSILENHPELQDRWPKLRYVRTERSTRRHKVDTHREIQLVGGRILALGAGAKVRGLLRPNADATEMIRPDLLLIDDIDSPEQARSKLQTDRLEDWLFADLLGLTGTKVPMTCLCIGTTIAADALVSRAVKKKGRFSNWTVGCFPAEHIDVKGMRRAMWPEGMSLKFLKTLTDPRSETWVGPAVYAREYLLDPHDIVGAMWSEALLSQCRWEGSPNQKQRLIESFSKISVAVDPSWGTTGDECGIVVLGLARDRQKAYVLEDCTVRAAPKDWGRAVMEAFRQWNASEVVVETAWGAEQIKLVFEAVAPLLPIRTIRASKTAGTGADASPKIRRMEPVRTMYERGVIFHVGVFEQLETSMCEWTEESHYSPDRIDALCTGIHSMLLGASTYPAKVSSVKDLLLPQHDAPRQRVIGGGKVW